jgi:serine/threonine protein kinase
MPLMASLDVVQLIGGYHILRLIGEGGMGRVFACRDDTLDREVAVKVLLPERAADEAMVQRFLREGRAMAKITSPHVVTIFQVGEDDGVPFLVMELLEGMDLETRLRKKGRLPIIEAVGYVRDAVFGLKAAEAAGVIHRDIKPANLFVVDGRVKVTDFGLARPLDGSENVTKTGLLTGSPHFMPPERVKGEPEDLRSDIYALGVTFFTLLAGRPPFARESPIDTISAHVTEAPPPIRQYCKDATVRLEQLLNRMMAKSPDKRFNRYDSLLYALDTATRDMMGFDLPSRMADTSAESEPIPEKVEPPPRPESPQKAESLDEEAPAEKEPVAVEAAPAEKAEKNQEEAPRQVAEPPKKAAPPPKAETPQKAEPPQDVEPAREAEPPSPPDAEVPKPPKPPPKAAPPKATPPKATPPKRAETSKQEEDSSEGAAAPEDIADTVQDLPEIQRISAHTTTSTELEVPEDVHKLGPVPSSAPFEYEAPSESDGPKADAKPKGPGAANILLKKIGASAFGVLQPKIKSWQALDDDESARMQTRLGIFVPLGMILGLLVLGGLFALIMGGGGALDRIDGGEAATVLAEIEAKDPADLKPEDLLIQGHALHALKRYEQAFISLQKALEGGAWDDRALNAALGELWRQEPKQAITLLVGWPDAVVNDRLQSLIQTETSWAPIHALKILKERFVDQQVDRQALGIRLIFDGDSCPVRAEGLRLLRKDGQGDAVLEALNAAQSRMPENSCMRRSLKKAITEVKKRGGGKK